jgi:hypothetical protein
MRIEGGSYDSSMKWTAWSSEIALNTWHHLAYVRYNNKVYMYVNGTATDSGTTIGSLRNNSTSVLIGKRIYGTYTNAYLDDIRITKGLARYTANFTPPTAAFYTSANVNITDTKYISQIGGWDDTDVDYGIKKISNSELSVKKMGADVTTRPIDRLYVNVQKLGAVGEGVAFSNTFTADGIVSGFALDSSVPQAKDLLVTINGIIQRPIVDYTLSNNTGVYFNSALTSGFNVEARHLSLGPSGAAGPAGVAGTGVGIAFDQIFTGDGTTTNYLLSSSAPNARDLLVVVEGMVQSPTIDYTLLGGTGVSFTTGVPSGQELSIRYLSMGPSGAAGPSGAGGGVNYSQDIFTGNGVVSGFSMGRTVSNILETTVFVNGLAQISDVNYFVNGTGLTFTSGDIASGDLIMVRHVY